jgi:hypothetical protein
MGFRSVFIFDNDMVHDLASDPLAGAKIADAIRRAPTGEKDIRVGTYGYLVESAHGNTQTLAVIDSTCLFSTLASQKWNHSNMTDEQRVVELLKSAAAKVGYRLVK